MIRQPSSLNLNKEWSLKDPLSFGQAVRQVGRALIDAGIDTPQLEARILVAAACDADTDTVFAHPDRKLSRAQTGLLWALTERRVKREPIAYILGHREFWSLDFDVGPGVLIPRPDSETVIQSVLADQHKLPTDPNILDLGTGSGALLLTLLTELRNAWGLGIDKSPDAITFARRNARKLGVSSRASFLAANWGDPIRGEFDAIICNPPYIPETELKGLAPEIKIYEPHQALEAGCDGLVAYRYLSLQLFPMTKPGGKVYFEVGQGQADAVMTMLTASGFVEAKAAQDLAGIDRCVSVRRPQNR